MIDVDKMKYRLRLSSNIGVLGANASTIRRECGQSYDEISPLIIGTIRSINMLLGIEDAHARQAAIAEVCAVLADIKTHVDKCGAAKSSTVLAGIIDNLRDIAQ